MKIFSFVSKVPGLYLVIVLLSSFNPESRNIISTNKLELQFDGLEAQPGSSIMIAVYRDKNKFLGDNPYKSISAVTTGKSTFTYSLKLPEGDYAIAFFQDLNDNGKLDKNMVGYPKEPFGFSNNAPVNFGPPKWQDAVFSLDKSKSMKIKL